MKFCPTCQTHYDEDILRFCTKDGTPLIDEEPPNFIEKPSESFDPVEDDIEAQTVIRRKTPVSSQPTDNLSYNEDADDTERIVISTAGAERNNQQVRTKQTPPAKYTVPPPRKTNTAKIVFLTIVLTLIALLSVGGAYYFFTRENVNSNQNTNLNSNADNLTIDTNMNIDNSLFDPNFNSGANLDVNTDVNSNTNANTKTPSPTPTRTPSPTPTPDDDDNSNANSNTNANSNANVGTNSGTPTRTPTPRPTPSTTATPRPSPTVPTSPVNVGNVNGRAVNLPSPNYPQAARNVQAKGRVTVRVTIDESGNVISAAPVSGHPLLRGTSADAARRARFTPVKIGGEPVKAVGTVVYNFVNN